MSRVLGTLRTGLLGISRRETTFERRGFLRCGEAQRQHLERVGATFIDGYHAALTWDVTPALTDALERVDHAFRGFAYEGAAMAMGLLDLLTPWRRDRVESFLTGAGEPHVYMVHVGVGFALARLKRRVEPAMDGMHALYRWLVVDGYGFHEGYFHWRESFVQLKTPNRLSGYALRVFDQGLGRALWFAAGAEAKRVAEMIGVFPEERRCDVWSGIGLASAYAGGVDRDELERIRELAASHGGHLAQGAAFAAKARQRAGNPMPHTETACEVYCGISADAAAKATDDALIDLVADAEVPAFEVWRDRVRKMLAR